jgi:deoxyhypusine synthase
MAHPNLPVLELVLVNYKNFNARATRDALIAYWRHIEGAGACSGRSPAR